MKLLHFVILLSFMFIGQISMAQFNYQAVLRDANNNPIINTENDINVEILSNNVPVYKELHPDINSGELGIINLTIGSGSPSLGSYTDIDWSRENYEIVVKIGLTILPSTPILSVPIAEYAKNSHWKWDSADSVLYFNKGQVALNTSILDNSSFTDESTFRIQGYPDWASLYINQGADGASKGIVMNSGNSNHTARIFLNDDVFSLGRGNGTRTINIRSGGKVGIIETNPASTFHVKGLTTLTHATSSTILKLRAGSSSLDTWIASYDENNNRGWLINMGDRSENNRFGIYRDGTGYALTIDQSGQTSVKCLKIMGGCDIKEDLNSKEILEPGDVVVIDENHPGFIRRSGKAYDEKVAGVISGANGVNPGLSLGQEGVLTGDYPLAMVGRVYVKVSGKVNVGDMLTTSKIPGHAMSVKNNRKSNGSIIGKAMTSNEQEEGMVLVLINLQ